MEQLKEFDIVTSSLEVVLQEDVDGRFKNERIVDRNVSNPRLLFRTKSDLKIL